jgi:ABC-2 type transport system permease protein
MKNILFAIRIAAYSLRNEVKAILTDGGALLILFGASLIYPVAYSIAYKNDVIRELPVAFVDLDKTTASRNISRMIDATEKTKINVKPGSLKEAEELFWEGKVNGVILVPEGFEKNIVKGTSATISVYCDASHFLMYKETLASTLAVSSTYAAGVEIVKMMSSGYSQKQAMLQRDPLQTEFKMLYNPAGSYGGYVMPGILLIILQQALLVGIGMISGASREKKDHSIRGLRFGHTAFPIIIGRSLAYFGVALITSTFMLLWVYDWFGFPSKSGYFSVFVLLVPYIFATIFMGFTISFLFRKREQSIMFLVFLSPIVLFMSGISWPKNSMPAIINIISSILPSSYMVPAYLRVRTMGVGLTDVRHELMIICIQAIIYCALAVTLYYIMRKSQIRRSGEISPVVNEETLSDQNLMIQSDQEEIV